MQKTISSLKERIESTYTPATASNTGQGSVNDNDRTGDEPHDQPSSDIHSEEALSDTGFNLNKETERFIKIVSWSDDDNCYIGLCPEVTSVECRGNNEKDVFESLCNIVDETVALHRLLGKDLPGSRQLIAGNITQNSTSYFSNFAIKSSNEASNESSIEAATSVLPDAGTPYRFRSTLMSGQNRFLRDCSTRIRMS